MSSNGNLDDKSVDNNVQETKEDSHEEGKIKPSLALDFDPERRKLALELTRESRKFSRILMLLALIVSFLILVSRITIFMTQTIEQFSTDPFIVTGIFFIAGYLILAIVEFPLSFYSHNRFDRKFGLSKLSNKQWLKRTLKSELISIAISLFVFEVFYWILRTVKETWWIWATFFMIFFSVVLSTLVPILILPRFYKLQPLSETHPDTAQRLIDLLHESGIQVENIYNLRLSDTSTMGNAALVGFGKTRRVLVSDTILDKYTLDEIEWIVGHEIGHQIHKDMWKRVLSGIISAAIMFYLTNLMFGGLTSFFGYPTEISNVATLPVLGLSFWIASEALINVPSLWLSRRAEKAADLFACSVMRSKDYKIVKSLFIKMADQNLSDLNPPRYEKFFFMEHPPITERMAYTKDYLSNLS
ncbi:MAG: M48 family metalloprotease [Candidatus Hodarchaeales archaeon]